MLLMCDTRNKEVTCHYGEDSRLVCKMKAIVQDISLGGVTVDPVRI